MPKNQEYGNARNWSGAPRRKPIRLRVKGSNIQKAWEALEGPVLQLSPNCKTPTDIMADPGQHPCSTLFALHSQTSINLFHGVVTNVIYSPLSLLVTQFLFHKLNINITLRLGANQ